MHGTRKRIDNKVDFNYTLNTLIKHTPNANYAVGTVLIDLYHAVSLFSV